MTKVTSITILLFLCMCHATEHSKPLLTNTKINTNELQKKQFYTAPINFLIYPGRDVFQEYTIQFLTSEALLKFFSYFNYLNANFDFEKFLPPQRYISAAIKNEKLFFYFFSKEQFPQLKPIVFLPEFNEGFLFLSSMENKTFILCSQSKKPVLFLKNSNQSEGFFCDSNVLNFVKSSTEMGICNELIFMKNMGCDNLLEFCIFSRSKDSNLSTLCVGKIDNNGDFEKFLQCVSKSNELNFFEFCFAKISMSFQKLYDKYLNLFVNNIPHDGSGKGCVLFMICAPYVFSISFIPCVQLNLSFDLNTYNGLVVVCILLSTIFSCISFYAALPFHLMALPLEMYTQSCYSILFVPQILISTFFVLFPPINEKLLQSFKDKTNKMWVLPYIFQKQIRNERSWKRNLFTGGGIFVIGFILNLFFVPLLCPYCPGECF